MGTLQPQGLRWLDPGQVLPPARCGGGPLSAAAPLGAWPDEAPEESAAAAELRRRQLSLPHVPAPASSPAPPGANRKARRPARFKVAGQFDGVPSATVTIADGLFTVRPFGRRRVYELRLADVARGVLYDVIKAELAARAREKRNKKGRRA